jgi:hypothetical protein
MLEKNSVNEIEDKVKYLESKIDDGLKQIEALEARVTTASNKIAFPNPYQPDVFVNMKMADDAANVANKYMEDTKMKSAVEELDFKHDRTILTQLEQIIALGSQTEDPTKMACSLFRIRGDKSYCVKVKSDTEDCYISSACCLEDGPIILAISACVKSDLLMQTSLPYIYTLFHFPGHVRIHSTFQIIFKTKLINLFQVKHKQN